MDDQPLRAGGGIDEIISRYQGAVYGLALAKTRSPADADDVFQEVFLAYFQSGKAFRSEEHRKAWLLRTTLNMCRRITTSTWRRKTVAYRLPLYLFYFQELSTQEIAKALSIRPGTVRMRLSRGREQLRDALKGGFFDE